VLHVAEGIDFEDKFSLSDKKFEKVFDMPENKLKIILSKLNLYDIEMDLVKKKLLVYKTNLDSQKMKFTLFSKQSEIVKDIPLDGHKVNLSVTIHKATRNPELIRETTKKMVVD